MRPKPKLYKSVNGIRNYAARLDLIDVILPVIDVKDIVRPVVGGHSRDYILVTTYNDTILKIFDAITSIAKDDIIQIKGQIVSKVLNFFDDKWDGSDQEIHITRQIGIIATSLINITRAFNAL